MRINPAIVALSAVSLLMVGTVAYGAKTPGFFKPEVEQYFGIPKPRFNMPKLDKDELERAMTACLAASCFDDPEVVRSLVESGRVGLLGLRHGLRLYVEYNDTMDPELKEDVRRLVGILDQAQWPLGDIDHLLNQKASTSEPK